MDVHDSPAISHIAGNKGIPSDTRAEGASFPIPSIPVPDTPTASVVLTPEQAKQQREYAIYFIQNTIRALGAAAVFGLSVTAAVISGGTMLPIAVLTGAALVIAIGDACCAYYNYQRVCQQNEPLQTASDSVAFVVSQLALKCGASFHGAHTLANYFSLLIRSGIAVASIVMPLVFPPLAAKNIAASLAKGSVSTSVCLTAIGAVLDYCLARNQNSDEETPLDESPADPCSLLAEEIITSYQSSTPPEFTESASNVPR